MLGRPAQFCIFILPSKLRRQNPQAVPTFYLLYILSKKVPLQLFSRETLVQLTTLAGVSFCQVCVLCVVCGCVYVCSCACVR
jgi:hypothetical protein